MLAFTSVRCSPVQHASSLRRLTKSPGRLSTACGVFTNYKRVKGQASIAVTKAYQEWDLDSGEDMSDTDGMNVHLESNGEFRAHLDQIMDGPNLFVFSSSQPSNLGVMSSLLDKAAPSAQDLQAMREVPAPFEGALYFNGTAIFGSLVLLIVLLALSFERILGLDRFIAKALQDWKERRAEEKRDEINAARQRLQRSLDDEV